jgi:hypothetical protein
MQKPRGGIEKAHSLYPKIRQLRAKFDGDTQRIRGELILDLKVLMEMAQSQATFMKKGQWKKTKEHREWARIAAYISQIISNIAKGYDNVKIEADLKELERLIREQRAKESKSA